MNPQREPLETLKEIRSLMERSSRFRSLSGLSGVVAGMAAIAGVTIAYRHLGLSFAEPGYADRISVGTNLVSSPDGLFLAANFGIVLLVSILVAAFLAGRKARKEGLPVWDATVKRLVANMAIPLATGGVYVLILLYHGQLAWIAPATLIFYGLALLNASKYTLDDIRYLGIIEIITGLAASIFIDYGLLFWAFGFGLVHIVYGSFIYLKYEK